MAKVVKKASKKTQKSASQKTKSEAPKAAPAITPGLVSISMLPSELATLSNLMSVCAKIFEEQALIAAEANDEARYAILSHRHKLSSAFAHQFVEFCKIGEPESRDFH